MVIGYWRVAQEFLEVLGEVLESQGGEPFVIWPDLW